MRIGRARMAARGLLLSGCGRFMMKAFGANWVVAMAAAAMLAAGTLAGCAHEKAGPSLGQIKDNASAYNNRRVTVQGEVDKIVGERAFAIKSGGMFGKDRMLVITPEPARLSGQPVQKGDDLMLTGTVRAQTFDQIEQETGVRFSPEVKVEYRDKPVLVADHLALKDRPSVAWSYPSQQPRAGAGGAITDVSQIASSRRPESLVGETIQLRGVNVQEVSGTQAFWVGDNAAERVLVVVEQPYGQVQSADELDEGETVNIQGTVQRMPDPATAKSQWNLDTIDNSELANKPLYIRAERINPGGG